MRRELNAMELVLYLMVGLSSMPSALGFAPLPPSLASGNAIIGRWALLAFLTGCALCVAGMMMRRRVNGVTVQQIGLAGLFFAGPVYAAALVNAAETWYAPLLAVGLSGGIGVGAAFRFRQLRTRVNERLDLAHGDPDVE